VTKLKILNLFPKWMKLKNYRIEQKLLLTYPPLIALSILVVSTFAILLSVELFREKSISFSENMLKQISYNIDTQLSRIDQDTVIFYQSHDVTDFFASGLDPQSSAYYQSLRKIREFLTNFLISHQNVETIYLINNIGEVVSTSDTMDRENTPTYYSEKALEGDGRIVWLRPKQSMIGNRVIPAVREIFDTSTLNRNGTLLLHLKENSISSLLEEEHIGNNISMMVIDRSGYVISSNVKNQLGTSIDNDILNSVAETDGIGGYFFREEDGEKVYYNFYKSSFTNWIYLFRIPGKELFSGYDIVQKWVIIVTVFFIIVGIVCSRIIAYNISKPIIRIIKEMRNIEMNNLLVNVNYDGKDELTSLASSFNSMIDQVRRLMKKESDLQRMKHELEMRAMQAEINPHFLYNTLEAINWMGRMNNIPKICDMTTMLADMMRYSINRMDDLVTLKEELEHVSKYLNIQQIRFEDKLSVMMDIDEHILQTLVPKLTLQPIVENAIVHGLSDKIGMGKIRIIGTKQEGKIELKVEDNGCGISQEKLKEFREQGNIARNHRGIGVNNVNQRIRLFFGEQYGLRFTSEVGKGTRVTILLPEQLGGSAAHARSIFS
jgi:two-component system sensor histidine kinase YesM